MPAKPTSPSTTAPARTPDKGPPIDPHADTEVARLASAFGERTVTARTLARLAEDGDDPDAHRRAARAALDAGRPAHARRLVARALELEPGDPETTNLARAAELGMKDASRAATRGGEMFAAELYQLLYQARDHLGLLLLTATADPALVELVGDIGRDPDQVCGIDLVNLALSRVGAGGLGLYTDASGKVGVRRIQQKGSKDSTAALLARVEAEGTPCGSCGAPRWSFAVDEDHGEYCATCAWPLGAQAMAGHRRRRSNEQLQAALAGAEEARTAAEKGKAAAELAVKSLEGKIAKLTQTVEKEQQHRRHLIAGGVGQASLAELSVEELAAAARGAAERATASASQADAVAVEIARRAGGREIPG